MTDTTLEAQLVQQQIFNRKTESERFLIGAEFIDFGRKVMIDSIKAQHPNILQSELMSEIVKRCYSNFFPKVEMDLIISQLMNYWDKKEVSATFPKV